MAWAKYKNNHRSCEAAKPIIRFTLNYLILVKCSHIFPDPRMLWASRRKHMFNNVMSNDLVIWPSFFFLEKTFVHFTSPHKLCWSARLICGVASCCHKLRQFKKQQDQELEYITERQVSLKSKPKAGISDLNTYQRGVVKTSPSQVCC